MTRVRPFRRTRTANAEARSSAAGSWDTRPRCHATAATANETRVAATMMAVSKRSLTTAGATLGTVTTTTVKTARTMARMTRAASAARRALARADAAPSII